MTNCRLEFKSQETHKGNVSGVLAVVAKGKHEKKAHQLLRFVLLWLHACCLQSEQVMHISLTFARSDRAAYFWFFTLLQESCLKKLHFALNLIFKVALLQATSHMIDLPETI